MVVSEGEHGSVSKTPPPSSRIDRPESTDDTTSGTSSREKENKTNLERNQEKLTRDQYQLVLYFEQQFWRTGSLPTREETNLKVNAEFTQAWWDTTLAHPKFRLALQAKGLPEFVLLELDERTQAGLGLSGTSGSRLAKHLLTEEQVTVANVMLDVQDKRSRLKKLTELGISTNKYNSWLREPLYREYCLARAEDLLVQNQAVAHLSLINNVERGDLSSIKYFNAMTGRFRERQSADMEVNIQNNYGSDVLIKVVEIIQRHVKDPAVLDLIASDILALTRSAPVGVPSIRGELI